MYVWFIAEAVQAFADAGVNHRVTGFGRNLCLRQEQQCGYFAGFYPVRSWKFLKMGTAQLLWVEKGKKKRLMFRLNLPYFNLNPLPSSSHLAPLWRAWLYLIDDLLIDSPGWTGLDPATSLHRASAPAPDYLIDLLLNSLQLIDAFLVLGAQNWRQYVHLA